MPDSQRSELIRALPYARRYARALTGSQPRGDLLVAESLRDLASRAGEALPARHGLYRAISQKAASLSDGEQPHTLTLIQRELLLLTTLEGVSAGQAARILELKPEEAEAQIAAAHKTIRSVSQTSILIIEDEPIIAMDIEDLVLRCGHTVAGVAHTQAEAVALAKETRPGLILADINLGDGGNGMDAVTEIMQSMTVPVIFVTAYPECLLTGNTVEPSFVITKPFEPMTLATATYQAITGGVPLP
ncbi:response regulator [Acetobacter oeni]|uniref:Response regulator n=1 Tax=Acetobacter oeni TaxID=304077 RepID=A0A511XGD4_9PROT|nr:response regulator [Acetobacter oeni]MBB3881816.1 CheY-like chemotaxis protein [Acetobacter oeni]NHO17383.1 response regulator [Acetobacter oeni]GBR02128.1 two-component response regulator [Acetobacter oeni LMG 21952]GEN62010.1 response regulator [Acetobacter oeni]